MDGLSNADLKGEDSTTNSIVLDYQRWNQGGPSSWELEEQERDELRGINISVQQWLQQQPSSRPSQNTIINSQSLHLRKRLNNSVLDRVDDAFGSKSKPSSVQPAESLTTTTPYTQNPPTSTIAFSVDRRLQKPKAALPSSEPSSTTSDRKTRYSDNGNHDEGRPPHTLTSQPWSAISNTPFAPQTRGVHKESIAPQQQVSWLQEATEASLNQRKLPKRQSSRLTDAETASRHPFPKRYRSGHKSHSVRRRSPVSSDSSRISRPAIDLNLEAPINTSHGVQQRNRNDSSPLIHNGPGQSSAQRDSSTLRTVSQEDFENACHICFFWLFAPERFSSDDRHACYGRKTEISHIISHVIDHHGLIRGRDPKNDSRRYLTRCQKYDPFIKQKGSCGKCNSLYEWSVGDFMDTAHRGIALCLRCWCRFDKKEMQHHLDGPLCTYNTEQPKAKKVYILYTTFCSETKKPSQPPEPMASGRSNHRPTPTKPHGINPRQRANNQSVRRPVSKQTPRGLRPASIQLLDKQGNQKSPQMAHFHPPAQDQLTSERLAPTTQSTARSHAQQPAHGDLSLWQQANTYQPNQQPIGYVPVPIFASPPPGIVVFPPQMAGIAPENRHQNELGPFYPSTALSTSFSHIATHDRSSDHGFSQQPSSQKQNEMLPPRQHRPPLQPLRQTSQPPQQSFSGTMGQAQPQCFQNESPFRFSHHIFSRPEFLQPSSQFPIHNKPASGENQQHSPMQPPSQNRSTFQACLDAANTSQPQRQATTPADDPDTTVSLSDITYSQSQLQSSPSRVPSTVGESIGLWQPPNRDESLWLNADAEQDEGHDNADDANWFIDLIGLNPNLQAYADVPEPPARQPSTRLDELTPNAQITPAQQAALEKESGYHSRLFDDDELDVDSMFMID
ncbi:hypothetical protein F66182_6226 [Fusarium sp. NRRL 66182]|nr:hypothetical protein F66182_6226 [Fusarium sp. NRRL 66182]